MAAVKGSKQIRMRVVPDMPVRTWGIRAALAGCMALVAAAAWFWGHQQGVDVNGDAREERDMLMLEVADLKDRNAMLDQQILNLEQASMVDKEALASVQETILNLREQISQLEEDVLFYKQVLSPDNDETGLVIGQFDLIATDVRDEIRYRLELKQQGSNESVISGYVNVNVLGLQNDNEVSIPLRGLSASIDALDIKLQFRYFQNIEGVLTLPAGFEPQKVQIIAVAEGDNGKTVQKSFGWLVRD